MSEKENTDIDTPTPCPTQGGTHYGYQPEWQNNDDIWKPIDDIDVLFVNCPLEHEVLQMANLVSWEKANIVIWSFKDSSKNRYRPVRIVPYKIVYDMKAYRQEEDAKEMNMLDVFRATKHDEPLT